MPPWFWNAGFTGATAAWRGRTLAALGLPASAGLAGGAAQAALSAMTPRVSEVAREEFGFGMTAGELSLLLPYF